MKNLYFLLLLSTLAYSFPENVRHGYVNCTTCHISPSGGGLPTEYGRGLSEQVMTTWSKEGEGKFLHGMVKTPEFLSVGGDFRSIQLFRDTPTFKEGKYIIMQADAEAAVKIDKFTFDATFGFREVNGPHSLTDNFLSRRHYLMYQATDQIHARFGRFQKNYGIGIPEHSTVIKKGLGWDQGTETYNLELGYINADFDFFVTGIFGRLDLPSLNKEKGIAFSTSLALKEKYKLGLSYFYGDNNSGHRHVFGPFVILGFTKQFSTLIEVDFQKSFPNSTSSTFGMAQYLKVDYEVVQGIHLYMTEEYSKLNFQSSNSEMNAYGIGTQFLPRPHFEFNLYYQKQRMKLVNTNFSDFFGISLHYYL